MSQMLTSVHQLSELVQKWGFVPLFKNEIPGFSVEELTPPELWFTDLEGPWEWKGPVIRETGCAYGKFFRGKAVFVSREWFLDFANYRRDGYDFDARFDDGLVSYQDKYVFELLDSYESLLSKELKRLGDFRKGGRKGFDTIITRLQMQGYVTTIDFEYQKDKFGKVYGWGVARYATPEKYFGEEFREKVYGREPEESRERIVAHIRGLFPEAEERDIRKLVG